MNMSIRVYARHDHVYNLYARHNNVYNLYTRLDHVYNLYARHDHILTSLYARHDYVYACYDYYVFSCLYSYTNDMKRKLWGLFSLVD